MVKLNNDQLKNVFKLAEVFDKSPLMKTQNFVVRKSYKITYVSNVTTKFGKAFLVTMDKKN